MAPSCLEARDERRAHRVTTRLIEFGLTAAPREWVPRFVQANKEAFPVVLELEELEAEDGCQRRIARFRQAARLPPGKTFETLDASRLSHALVQQLREFETGACLDTATNVLAFGLPDVGKSHALCAVAHALVDAGTPGVVRAGVCAGPRAVGREARFGSPPHLAQA